MDKLKAFLLIIFLIGIVGAINSISNQSTVDQEKGFVNGILTVLGLTYIPDPDPIRFFEFVPALLTSEIEALSSRIQFATPSASPTPGASTKNFPSSQTTSTNKFASPTPSPLNSLFR